MSTIDFRLRAATPAFVAHLRWRTDKHAQKESSHVSAAIARALPVPQLIEAMDAAGISLGVFTGRDWVGDDADWPLTNESIAHATAESAGRLIGYGGVDPRRPDVAGHCRHSIGLGLKGLCVDGFVLATGPHDPAFFPVYEACLELDVPIVITVGALPGVPAPMSASHPHNIDEVARRYPGLRILASHAGWPYTSEMLGVAFRHDNVWIENSFYHFAPGVSGLMVEAANGWLADRIMYASAFPSAPLRETLEAFAALPFTDEARRKVLHDNAASFLGLADA